MMLEQPLAHDDIFDHASLQRQMQTPVCLDESIQSAEDAAHAISLGSCKIINVKLGRVGGHTEAKRIEQVTCDNEIPVWCGGMLESGIGRAHNIALASLPGFTLPGDISASSRYFERDIISPAVTVAADGTVAVPDQPGLGFDIDLDFIKSLTETRVYISRMKP
jgi:O-succinylbenzoate synthase